jgi:protein-disulfide isomerase
MAALGIFITGYLSYASARALDVRCGGSLSCAVVLDSEFAKFPHGDGGTPVAYIGLAGYIALFAIALVRGVVTGPTHRKLAVWGFVMSALGLVFSLYLTYRSIADVGQKCIWCLSSLGVIVLMTIGHAALLQGDVPSARDEKPSWMIGGLSFVAAMVVLVISVQDLKAKADITSYIFNLDVPIEEALPQENKIRGDSDAKVTLLEFADFNCSHCRSNYPRVKEALKKYGDRVRLAYRNLPLMDRQGHETSLDAAVISEFAAEKGLFWKYVDTMYMPSNKERIKTQEGLISVAVEVGLDRRELFELFEGGAEGQPSKADKYFALVEEDIKAAEKLLVRETPTFFLYAEGQKPKAIAPSSLESDLDKSPYRELLR